jgi:kynurenine 3-monooxygenase
MARDAAPVTIIGAGLAGCLLATLLARRGIPVTVFERRPDPRMTGGERGRSINLAISARGLDALARVGLSEPLLALALPMHGRMVHPLDNAPTFRPYSADGRRAINSVNRADLNQTLLDAAEAAGGVDLRFAHRLIDLDVAARRLVFDTPDGVIEEKADVVLATDGAYSAARRAIQFREGFSYGQDFLEHGYKELSIPARHGDFALDPDVLHIWPRGTSMMIALPNRDRSFTCTVFWPLRGAGSFAELDTTEQITGRFRVDYPDAASLMPGLVEDYQRHPVGALLTVRCWPWTTHEEGCVVALVGDAAHAIVPFYGQGANCAFEDCIELDRCLGQSDGDWPAALSAYQDRRKPNTDAIAEMALENFVEMRDKVNSRLFQLKTASQHALERRSAGRYVSRYELVSFTTVPYAEIPRRMRRQNVAVGAVATAGLIGAVALGRWVRHP